ncbi:hypothetical protein J8273_8396 [Carpediemonas membranifera]|uniref:Suppressor of forked domain-containing protein n=1 Tax=Carpediemonas membranifera TaxID=201153 RepID=A0A8J6E0S4_9EUKA|nr:hypothetical protein J8273_8396 [Carpediemonas membranifera]|eukprot:KAG9389722.1 hypothetical protein J8273_8396 [Carpediemonas membranifera]
MNVAEDVETDERYVQNALGNSLRNFDDLPVFKKYLAYVSTTGDNDRLLEAYEFATRRLGYHMESLPFWQELVRLTIKLGTSEAEALEKVPRLPVPGLPDLLGLTGDEKQSLEIQIHERRKFERCIVRTDDTERPKDGPTTEYRQWAPYIAWELEQQSPYKHYRVCSVFEQALLSCLHHPVVWLRYSQYLMYRRPEDPEGTDRELVRLWGRLDCADLKSNIPFFAAADYFEQFSAVDDDLRSACVSIFETLCDRGDPLGWIEYYKFAQRRGNPVQLRAITERMKAAAEENEGDDWVQVRAALGVPPPPDRPTGHENAMVDRIVQHSFGALLPCSRATVEALDPQAAGVAGPFMADKVNMTNADLQRRAASVQPPDVSQMVVVDSLNNKLVSVDCADSVVPPGPGKYPETTPMAVAALVKKLYASEATRHTRLVPTVTEVSEATSILDLQVVAPEGVVPTEPSMLVPPRQTRGDEHEETAVVGTGVKVLSNVFTRRMARKLQVRESV